MTIKHLPAALVCLFAVGIVGCNSRGADDRITLPEDYRQENHGPGYTVVALRKVDRARLSNSGVVIVNDPGWEPVYVTQVAYTRHDAEQSREDVKRLQAIHDRLGALQVSLEQRSTAVPVVALPAAPVPAPVSVAVPVQGAPVAQFNETLVEAPTPAAPSVQPNIIRDSRGNPITNGAGTPITVGTP